MTMSKRSLLFGGVAIAAGYGALRFGVPLIWAAFPGEFQFEEISDPTGFRHLAGGQSSIGLNPMVGLDSDHNDGMQALIQRTKSDLCLALFGSAPLAEGTVPIASFSDYNCPYCRTLTPRLAKLEATPEADVRIVWHELPLLGDLSVLAAKAALSAKRQGAYVMFHQRLMRAAFLKTPEYIQRLAGDLGVDGDRLAKDMDSPEVLAEIQTSLALSRIFGLIGTPALVVGNTVVQGSIDDATLARLIKRERSDNPLRACM